MSEEDFENSIWEVQVEKNGNWFSGNYVPDSFKMAISNNENQTCEYAGESTTKGKWYMDSTSFYFERRPLGFLGPINPGMEYFRASLTGWTNDENTGDRLQTAGYVSVLYLCGGRVTRLCRVCPYAASCVAWFESCPRRATDPVHLSPSPSAASRIPVVVALFQDVPTHWGRAQGYSPLFPTAILGRFLMTKVKSVSKEEIVERRAYTNSVLNPKAAAPQIEAKKAPMLDLTDDLSEEERLRVEAAEWVPSSIREAPSEKEEGLEDKLGSAFDRIKKTVQDTDSFKELADNVDEIKRSSETVSRPPSKD